MTLFLDACLVIYWVELAEPYYSRLISKLTALRAKHPGAVFAASRLSLLECRTRPVREDNRKLLELYDLFFHNRI
jgi:hypothetical protein